MNKIIRLILFFFLCIPLRLIMAYLPQVIPNKYLPYYSIIVGFMAIGFMYRAITNTRLTALEGGGVTWWASYRFIHGMLLLTACIYLIRKDRKASIPLLLDVMVGISLFFIIRLGIFN